MDLSKINMKLFEEFMQFCAFKAAAEVKEAQEDEDGESSGGCSVTIGHESDPVDTHKEQHATPDEDHERSVTIGHSLDPAEASRDPVSMSPPSLCSNSKKNKGKA
ncbi:hypothetical protein FRC11_010578 [Ceratobasidium sp. 423]|nr:hypothetical protein FRC11_010578 [Ceratobasidium sp. 423]